MPEGKSCAHGSVKILSSSLTYTLFPEQLFVSTLCRPNIGIEIEPIAQRPGFERLQLRLNICVLFTSFDILHFCSVDTVIELTTMSFTSRDYCSC
jgi:hypothetical protein